MAAAATSTGIGLLRRATGSRHGVLLPPAIAPLRPADPAGVVHASVAAETGVQLESAGGGAGSTADQACAAAIAEALERYAAATADLAETDPRTLPSSETVLGFDHFTFHSRHQRSEPGFPWVAGYRRREVTATVNLADGRTTWVPAALVGLRGELGGPATSSGLAAGFSLATALLRAAQELVERDALMATWLHEVPGRRVAGPCIPAEVTLPDGSQLDSFDLTPAYSPHPVCLVAATIPLMGRPRIGVGAACRSTWADAAGKALLEALQSVVFAGEHLARHPELWGMDAGSCQTFEHHAVYYTANPERWSELPLLAGAAADPPPGARRSDPDDLRALVSALSGGGIDLLCRELTTADLWQIGLRVVRVLSPALLAIHHDHRFPHLGGTAADLAMRYPSAEPTGRFPSPNPHPLG